MKKRFQKLYLCGDNFKNITYRFSEKSKGDVLITLRVYKKIVAQILEKKANFVKCNCDTNQAIFDVGGANSQLRFDYIEYFTKKKSKLLISKNDLLHFQGIGGFLFVFCLLIVSFIPVFIISIFSKNKFHYPLLVQEFIECFQLSVLLSNNKIKKLHYFCIYERDANLCAFILMKQGFYVNKIPSEVPLYFFNKTIIANQLSCCFAYQEEECRAYNKTMFFDKMELWGPEKILQAPLRFVNKRKNREQTLYDIGFFSSGNWLRHKIGDANLGHNDKINEELVLQTLIEYADKHSLKLRLFIHPLEKKDCYKKMTLEYYSSILMNPIISLADDKTSSIEGFDEINVGVSLYSTLMFERIYLGFKTILAPFDYHNFPIENSGLKNICAESDKDLILKLDSSLKITTKEYFTLFDLERYSEFIN